MQRQPLFEDVVQAAHGSSHAGLEFVIIEGCPGREGVIDEIGQIHAAQETRAAGRQRFFSTGIDAGEGKFLRISQEIPRADAIPEKGTRFAVVPVRFGDEAEDVVGIDQRFDDLPRFLAGIMEAELLVVAGCCHEFIADADGKVSLGNFAQVRLQLDEIEDVRMITADALGAEAGNIDAAAAAIAVRAGQLAGPVENAFDIVFWRGHDVAVRQGNLLAFTFKSAVGQDAAAKEEFLLGNEIGYGRVMAADAVEPVVEGFAIIAIFVFPDIHAQLVMLAEPFLFVHESLLIA